MGRAGPEDVDWHAHLWFPGPAGGVEACLPSAASLSPNFSFLTCKKGLVRVYAPCRTTGD